MFNHDLISSGEGVDIDVLKQALASTEKLKALFASLPVCPSSEEVKMREEFFARSVNTCNKMATLISSNNANLLNDQEDFQPSKMAKLVEMLLNYISDLFDRFACDIVDLQDVNKRCQELPDCLQKTLYDINKAVSAIEPLLLAGHLIEAPLARMDEEVLQKGMLFCSYVHDHAQQVVSLIAEAKAHGKQLRTDLQNHAIEGELILLSNIKIFLLMIERIGLKRKQLEICSNSLSSFLKPICEYASAINDIVNHVIAEKEKQLAEMQEARLCTLF